MGWAQLHLMEDACQRLSQMIGNLQKQVAAGIAHGLTGFLILRIWNQLSRIATAMPQAVARAGLPTRPRAPRPYVPRPIKPLAHPMEAWRRLRLPRREGWLIPVLRPHIAMPYGDHLRILLAEPEMATLAATPRARRLLRPLCRMLGITDALPPPAPPRATPGPILATPEPVPASPPPPPVSPPQANPWAQYGPPTLAFLPSQKPSGVT